MTDVTYPDKVSYPFEKYPIVMSAQSPNDDYVTVNLKGVYLGMDGFSQSYPVSASEATAVYVYMVLDAYAVGSQGYIKVKMGNDTLTMPLRKADYTAVKTLFDMYPAPPFP